MRSKPSLASLLALVGIFLQPARCQSLGSACTGSVNYCAGTSGSTNIILRCIDGKVIAGNCNDNLGEPPNGAVCIESSPSSGDAECKALPLASDTGQVTGSTPQTPITGRSSSTSMPTL